MWVGSSRSMALGPGISWIWTGRYYPARKKKGAPGPRLFEDRCGLYRMQGDVIFFPFDSPLKLDFLKEILGKYSLVFVGPGLGGKPNLSSDLWNWISFLFKRNLEKRVLPSPLSSPDVGSAERHYPPSCLWNPGNEIARARFLPNVARLDRLAQYKIILHFLCLWTRNF